MVSLEVIQDDTVLLVDDPLGHEEEQELLHLSIGWIDGTEVGGIYNTTQGFAE